MRDRQTCESAYTLLIPAGNCRTVYAPRCIRYYIFVGEFLLDQHAATGRANKSETPAGCQAIALYIYILRFQLAGQSDCTVTRDEATDTY